MPSDDRAIRIKLKSKRRSGVISATRRLGREPFKIYEDWGLVADGRAALDEFLNHIENAETIWALLKERWVTPAIVAHVVQILSEVWEFHLVETARKARLVHLDPAAGLPISPKELHRIIKELRRARALVDEPPIHEFRVPARPDVGEALESIAIYYELLEQWLTPRAMPGRTTVGRGSAATQLDEKLGILLSGHLPTVERRRWTAKIVSEFLGVKTTPDELRRRESARAASRSRRRKAK